MNVATGNYISLYKDYDFDLYIILNEVNDEPSPSEVDALMDIVQNQMNISSKISDIESAIACAGIHCVRYGFCVIYGKTPVCKPLGTSRAEVVMQALGVDEEDADTIVDHLVVHGCEHWIDDYNADGRDEPLTDVHYEASFEDMIDWQYDDYSPSEMIFISGEIEDHPCMLELSTQVIFWYGLV